MKILLSMAVFLKEVLRRITVYRDTSQDQILHSDGRQQNLVAGTGFSRLNKTLNYSWRDPAI